MTQPAKAQEPSMEEILASIRRIISDDQAGRCGQAGTGTRADTEKRTAARCRICSQACGCQRPSGKTRGVQADAAASRADTGSAAGRKEQPGRHRRDARLLRQSDSCTAASGA